MDILNIIQGKVPNFVYFSNFLRLCLHKSDATISFVACMHNRMEFSDDYAVLPSMCFCKIRIWIAFRNVQYWVAFHNVEDLD